MNPAEFSLHFLRPWWWLALLPLPVVLWMLLRGRGRAAWARLVDASLLPHLLHDQRAQRHLMLGSVALAWLLATAALAGPAWQKVPTPLYVNTGARVIALSLSGDMLAQDLKPDRMARARFAVRDLLDAAGDARTALVAYAGAAFTVAPLTDDKRTVLNLLGALQPDVMPVPGNDAAAGIRQSLDLLRQANVRGGEIVLVTDDADAQATAAARAARAQGVRVDVLGIGTPTGAPVPRSGGGFDSSAGGLRMARRDDAALRAVAAAGGGRYVVLQPTGNDAAALGTPTAGTSQARSDQRAQLWRDGGVWLLPLLVVLAALAFRRGWLLVLALCLLPPALPTARAAELDSLWANRDQRALAALREGDAARAKSLATTPGMRGAADYRSGDYRGAARAFAQGEDARSSYNLGNSLARQGQYRKAIAAYRQALARDPGFSDARANLEAVENWLQRPRPHQPQSGKPGERGRQGQDKGSQAGQPSGQPTQGKNAQTGASPDRQQDRAGSPQQEPDQAAGSAARKDPGAEQRARKGLEQALQGARPAKSQADSKPFRLGQSQPQSDRGLDPQQQAMLRAVPDDPGALLRRKFRLEWEQRHGSSQGEQP